MSLTLRRLLSHRVFSPLHAAATVERLAEKLDAQRRDIKALKERLHEQRTEIRALRAAQHESAKVAAALAKSQLALTEQTGLRVTADVRALVKEVGDLSRRLDRQQKVQAKWETGVSWQLGAVIRRLCLPSDIPFPFKLAARRFKLRSQHEEDGYLLALLEEVGTTNRRFVEIGCGRSGGNAAILAFELGWSGLMVDANPDAIDYITKVYAFNDTVQGVVAEVTPENVNGLLAAHGCSGEVDLLSIDIDSYDYWVFEALGVCSPRVLMLEYNAGFGPDRLVTIPRGALVADAPKGYSGASLAALTALAARKGYRLVACEYSGVNAFYLRNDVAPAVPPQTVTRAYRPQMSRLEVDVERPGPEELYRRIAERHLPLQDV